MGAGPRAQPVETARACFGGIVGKMSRLATLVALLCLGCVTIEAPRPGAAPVCRADALAGAVVYVVDATYGGNCGALWGNATRPLAEACNGRRACEYRVDYGVIGDPAIGCGKEYVAEWRCGEQLDIQRTVAPPEAGYGALIRLSCDAPVPRAGAASAGTIEVESATYGGNCGAPHGNETTDLAQACNGLPQCRYRIDYTAIGDPAVACGKDYVAEWRCSGSRAPRRVSAAPEAGYGAVITLDCARP